MDDDLKPVWMDPRNSQHVTPLDVGGIGFLFRLDKRKNERGMPDESSQHEYRMLDHPATYMDGKGTKVLFGGPCHTYEQGSYQGKALGMARVVKIARNGRMKVEPLAPEEYPDAMEELGYPDLTPENKF